MVPTSWEKTDLRLKLPQNPKGLGIQGSCPDAGEKQTPKEGCIVRFSKDSSDLGQTGFVGRGAFRLSSEEEGPHVIATFLDVLEALAQVSRELAVQGFLLAPENSCP